MMYDCLQWNRSIVICGVARIEETEPDILGQPVHKQKLKKLTQFIKVAKVAFCGTSLHVVVTFFSDFEGFNRFGRRTFMYLSVVGHI